MGPRPAPVDRPGRTGSAIRLAADLDVLDRTAIDALRARNLAVMARAVTARPAARRHWFGDAAARELLRPDRLAELPLFTPADLARSSPPECLDLVLDSAGSGMVLRSSGTTGRRKVLYHSWPFHRRVNALGVRGLRAGDPPPPVRVAVCLHPAELNGAFSFGVDVVAGLGAQVYPTGSGMDPAELVDVLAEHEVDTLISPCGFATRLVTAPGVAGRLGHLRRFWYIGENLGPERLALLHAALPGLTVRSLSYSTSETGPIGYQCPRQAGSVHHVHEDAVLLEVVDPATGTPVPTGVAGDVVVTVITDSGMPLIRYVVGDRGRLLAEPCPCGSRAVQLELIGRLGQSMNVDSTTVSQDLVMEQLARLGVTDPATCQFQVLRDAYGFGVRLLVADSVPVTVTTDQVHRELVRGYHLARVLTSPTYRGFALERVPVDRFASTGRGKTPFFIELPVPATDQEGRPA